MGAEHRRHLLSMDHQGPLLRHCHLKHKVDSLSLRNNNNVAFSDLRSTRACSSATLHAEKGLKDKRATFTLIGNGRDENLLSDGRYDGKKSLTSVDRAKSYLEFRQAGKFAGSPGPPVIESNRRHDASHYFS